MDFRSSRDLRFLAQRRRGVLRQTCQAATTKPRFLPMRGLTPPSIASIQSGHLNCRPRQNHRGRQTSTSIRFVHERSPGTFPAAQRLTCNINRGEVMRVVTRQYSGEPWSNADQFFLSNVLASGMSLAEAAGFLGRTEDEVRKYGALISSAQRRNNRRWATGKRSLRLAKPIDVARTRPRSSRRSTSV